ncbi:M14 family metallopeptidase [Aquimarina sp. W85]|uniref:M14 family metallopeptidase n=1 Tax=Aquimarina rhodophyticola TaxID=3342246 RepID=UPI0036725E45
MKKIILVFFFTLFGFWMHSQTSIPSPEKFLGYAIGEQFTRHADVVRYFEAVANASDMVTYNTYGKTNERRPLTYAVISSAENLKNIETIRQNNLSNVDGTKPSTTPKVALVWLSYNVHGNEASSTEAAMKTLYTLITEKQEWLSNTVIIMDPCINPDGRDRYVNWYNQTRATPYTIDQHATEHNEPWPGGRPNHYLFDLNRDWAWATQIETQQRLKIYNQWMPHIHVDFHEQGINEPYYFAPAAEPFHEIITPWQRDFQTQIGKNHAKYFDKEGWLYFTKERFDLLYPSYGDTYPTFMGAIGMTYEQAGHGRAGLGIQTDEGYILTLKDRADHHTTTGLSTIEIASQNATKLNDEFRNFFSSTIANYKSYVLQGHQDKIDALIELLEMHDIQYGFSSNAAIKGFDYTSAKLVKQTTKNALVVSTNQPKGAMVTVLFEPKTKVSDPLTYDITAWGIPYAYGLEAIASKTLVPHTKNKSNTVTIPTTNPEGAGYIARWNSVKDAAFMADLLRHNIKVRFSEKDFTNGTETFKKGSLIISKSDNRTLKNYDSTVIEIAKTHKRNIVAAASGFATTGVDFGSPEVKLINNQKIALLKGSHTSSLSYGELWHFFEKTLKYPITSIDTDYFKSIDLQQYDVLILPDGALSTYLDKTTISTLKTWIANGGKVIAIGNAVEAFVNKEGFDLKKNVANKTDQDTLGNKIAYDQRERESVKNFVTGTIFKTKIDASHPMAFGYTNHYFSLKLGADSYKLLQNGYNVGYIDIPKAIAGFAGKDALKRLKNSLVFGEARIGDGNIIYMVDNPMFRAFWEHGKLFLVNAIFFTNSNKFRI